MSQIRILSIEDDIDFFEELEELLEGQNYQTESVRTLEQFRRVADLKVFDLFIVDLKLPDGDGADLIRAIREHSDAGIIVLSGKTDQTHKVLTLELGADDFVEKPINALEFVARIRRLLRRTGSTKRIEPNFSAPGVISYKHWTTSLAMRTVHNTRGEAIDLTKLEFELWVSFLKNQGKVLARERLIYLLRGHNWAGSERSIDGLVSRLRNKMKDDEASLNIKTVHGVGYSLEEAT